MIAGIAALGVAWLIVNAIDFRANEPRVEGPSVIVATRDYEVSFRRDGPGSATFMVFGGQRGGDENGFTDATFALISIGAARNIGREHPDFHMCGSSGAEAAQALVEAIHFIGTTNSVRATLEEAIDLHEQRLGRGGERTCLTVRGSEMRLDAVRMRDGTDLAARIRDALGDSRFYLAQAAAVEPCEALLH